MDILIDTNIFIHREDDPVVPKALRELERALNKAGHTIKVHPKSVQEIRTDENDQRREQAESRIETYVELSYPPTPTASDTTFRSAIPPAESDNEHVDNMLLFAVHEDAVDFLITEDQEMHSKALELGVQDRVFTIEGGRDYFATDDEHIQSPVGIEQTTLGDLDLSDPIFDSLKDEYPEFEAWAERKADRPAWVNYVGDRLGALLVIKPREVEQIGTAPPLQRKERLKISTLKVAEPRWGSKVGELLISIAIRKAITQEIEELYLTHYIKEEDYLVELLREYGFEHASAQADGEAIFRKRLTPATDVDIEPTEIAREYYPSFYDGSAVDKFIVPIQPQYHQKLFTAYEKRQPPLSEFTGNVHSEGNAIRKAYLTHSQTKQIEPGDLLLFYRSQDYSEMTSLGVCEAVHYRLTDPAEIQRLVGKRSVFSDAEIEAMATKPTTVLLFSWHFDLENPIEYTDLEDNGVLSAPPQAIQHIGEEGYKYIKQVGGIDGRFALD